MPAPAHPPLAMPAAPRVLVADDDPASLHFLADGLRTLGASVRSCANGEQALRLARDEPFDLLLLDCRMPGGGAREVLEALQADGWPGCDGRLAVASSAELGATERRDLLAAGFGEVLHKPCNFTDLRQLLARLPGAGPPVLDDDAALRASGDATTMQALRQLLRGELALLYQELGLPEHQRTSLDDRLHRLRSSCGFCGATALANEVVRLQQALRCAPGEATPAITHFRDALQATLQVLDT